MPNKRRIYLLDPQEFSPETIAVAFAKTSRSPESFDVIAAELSDEKSAQFHEKWVVGYGHSSVAEHAILHIAVENISRLAIECLESNRLASYTEKSSRYQKWDSDSFHTPQELLDHPLLETYQNLIKGLFEQYQTFLPKLELVAKKHFPQKEDESAKIWQQRIRTKYIDVARFLLPAASLANVGVTINARALEHALQKMFAHPLAEVRHMGDEIRKISQSEVPTLVKYVSAAKHLSTAEKAFANLPVVTDSDKSSANCQLVAWDADGEERILIAALYRYQPVTYPQAKLTVQQMSINEKSALIKDILELPDKFDIPIRELEHASLTFDMILDQGAYFELKRHRMMTQSPQDLTPTWGYTTPKWIYEAGLADEYHHSMQEIIKAYPLFEDQFPGIGSYLMPNAFNRRLLITTNLRSMLHLVKLRCAKNAHFSIRKSTEMMLQELKKVYPSMGIYFEKYSCQNWQEINQQYFG
ncbi:MAG: FAD-dependent thymidylate synthase [Anaerolineaceae bacterium]|nr:FAD-dependent thymidylate synthase [Anaerolineaceae bacterium]